jgi:cytochrome c oxidase assembly protein subunit 15
LLLALGGMQGVIGWWMVKSGIVNDTRVSHFRLATHLLVALTTLGGLVWTALDMRTNARGEGPSRLTGLGAVALVGLVLQLFYGALMAGLRAGHVAAGPWLDWSNWPLMQGRFLPAGIDWSQGPVHAALSDPYLVHFIHRWWAVGVVVLLTVLGRALRRARLRPVSIALHSVFGTQFLLGVATVMSGISLWVAVLHQLGGALLLAVTAWSAHALGRKGRAT